MINLNNIIDEMKIKHAEIMSETNFNEDAKRARIKAAEGLYYFFLASTQKELIRSNEERMSEK